MIGVLLTVADPRLLGRGTAKPDGTRPPAGPFGGAGRRAQPGQSAAGTGATGRGGRKRPGERADGWRGAGTGGRGRRAGAGAEEEWCPRGLRPDHVRAWRRPRRARGRVARQCRRQRHWSTSGPRPAAGAAPHVARATLEVSLPGAGISLQWEPRLGGNTMRPTPDRVWRNRSFPGTRRLMRAADFGDTVTAVFAEDADIAQHGHLQQRPVGRALPPPPRRRLRHEWPVHVPVVPSLLHSRKSQGPHPD